MTSPASSIGAARYANYYVNSVCKQRPTRLRVSQSRARPERVKQRELARKTRRSSHGRELVESAGRPETTFCALAVETSSRFSRRVLVALDSNHSRCSNELNKLELCSRSASLVIAFRKQQTQ